jgi:hypothetical protein
MLVTDKQAEKTTEEGAADRNIYVAIRWTGCIQMDRRKTS